MDFASQLNKEEFPEWRNKTLIFEQHPQKKKTIIFDLDETLVHCNESKDLPSDINLPITFPTGETIQAGINIRPYAIESLRQLSYYYEIFVFTASHNCYANAVLDYLDPENKYISQRLYRENCVQSDEGVFIKDLRVLINRNLNDVLIVDNAAYSFAFHIANGIPIIPYYNNKSDKELIFLTEYLLELAQYQNISQINQNVFRLEQFSYYQDPEIQLKNIYAQVFTYLEN